MDGTDGFVKGDPDVPLRDSVGILYGYVDQSHALETVIEYQLL